MFLYLIVIFLIISNGLSFKTVINRNLNKFKNVNRIKMSSNDDDNSSVIIGTAGVLSNVVVDYSLYVLKTTGCGLPPGPFGIEGALEGISYLAIIGIIGWSAVTKASTGSGLPAGKFGLVGAAEGLSYLSILAGIVIAGLNLSEFGYLPGFLPNDKCYGI